MSFESPNYDQVNVGDTLPELSIPVTAALVIGGAMASRDFVQVHHDTAHARSLGMPDIMMNMLTTQGLVGRYATDWAGINGVIKRLAVKLGAPNYPGDTMKMTGRVAGKADGVVTLEVTGSNSWGDHVNATVDVALPEA